MFRRATDSDTWVCIVRRDGTGLHEFKEHYSAAWVRRRDAVYLEHDDALWIAAAPAWRERRLMRIPGRERRNLSIGGCDVSPDGKWVALVLRVGGVDSVNVLNVASPGTLTSVSPAGAAFASRQRLYR